VINISMHTLLLIMLRGRLAAECPFFLVLSEFVRACARISSHVHNSATVSILTGNVPVRLGSRVGTHLPSSWRFASLRTEIASSVRLRPIRPNCLLCRVCTHTDRMSDLYEDIRIWRLCEIRVECGRVCAFRTLRTLDCELSWCVLFGVIARLGTESALCVDIDEYRPDCQNHHECERNHDSEDCGGIGE
jgi:hypothetical protein